VKDPQQNAGKGHYSSMLCIKPSTFREKRTKVYASINVFLSLCKRLMWHKRHTTSLSKNKIRIHGVLPSLFHYTKYSLQTSWRIDHWTAHRCNFWKVHFFKFCEFLWRAHNSIRLVICKMVPVAIETIQTKLLLSTKKYWDVILWDIRSIIVLT